MKGSHIGSLLVSEIIKFIINIDIITINIILIITNGIRNIS